MGTKVSVSDLTSDYASKQLLNTNFDTLADAFDNTLSRDGTSPNEMEANLDMNSNRILNLPAPVADQEPLRKVDGQSILDDAQADADAAAASAAASAASATAASGSASAASTSASDADASATAAANSASAAATSAATAAADATAAAAPAVAAAEAAEASAAASASDAATAASDAATSASDAAAAEAAALAAQAAAEAASNAKSFATIADLKASSSASLTNGGQAFIGSTTTINGLGYGTFVWVAASTATGDDVMVVQPSDISGAGRWHRLVNSTLDFSWWAPDTTGTTAVTSKIQAALNTLGALPHGGTLLIPPGQFKIDNQVQVDWLVDGGDISGGKSCRMVGAGTRASQFVCTISDSSKSMFYFGGGAVGTRAQGLDLEALGFVAAHDPSTYITTSNERNLIFCNFAREARFFNLLFYGGKGTQLCLGRPQNIQGSMIEFVGDQTYTQYGLRLTLDDASYGTGNPTGSNSGQAGMFTGISGRGHRSSSVMAASIYLEAGSEYTISGKIIESSQFAVISKASKCKISDFSWESSHVGDIGILMLSGDSCEICNWSVATVDGSLNEYVWLYCADSTGTYAGSYNGLDIHNNKLMDSPTGAVIHFGDGDGNRHSMFHHNFDFNCRTHISLNSGAEGKVFILDNYEPGTTPGYATTTGATPDVANLKRIAHIDGSAVTITQWLKVCPGEFYSMQFNGNQTIATTGPIKLLGSATPANGVQVIFWCSPTVTSTGLPVMEEVARPAH